MLVFSHARAFIATHYIKTQIVVVIHLAELHVLLMTGVEEAV